MSCKEKPNVSKSTHYTMMERKVFLQILEEYKHVIEVKRSNSATLKEKEFAWSEKCTKYNQSVLVYEERTVQQLKKLWANLKQYQREASTKERQSCMATGGRPQEMEANVDPDIVNIASHLMETAPVLFLSNMTEAEINDTPITSRKNNEESTTSCNLKTSEESSNKTCNTSKSGKLTKHNMKRKKKESLELLDTEEKLKIERIKQIINQEQELTHMRQTHKEEIANMKKEHLKEMNYIQLQHLKEMQKIEIQIEQNSGL